MPKHELADRLCAAIEHLTAERASRSYGPQWTVAEALAQRRIIGDGSNPPHSVALNRGLREG
jgi:hypothetical protein